MAGPSRTYWRKDQPHVPVERTRINSYGKPETYLEWDLYLVNHEPGQHVMDADGVCIANPGMDPDYYAQGPEHGYGGPQNSDYEPPEPPPPVPVTPTLDVQSTTTTDPDVLLTATTDADTFEFQRSTSSDFTSGVTALQNTSSNTYTDLSPGPGTYYYRVRAANENGNSQWSAIHTAVIVEWSPAATTTVAWYDAADTSTITTSNGGNDVTQMNDKSSNNFDLTVINANKVGPDSGTRTLNGLNVLEYSKTSTASDVILEHDGFNQSQPIVLTMLVRLDDEGIGPTGEQDFLISFTEQQNPRLAIRRTTSDAFQVLSNSGSIASANGSVTEPGEYLVTVYFNTTSTSLRINGNLISTGSIANNTLVNINLGGEFNENQCLDGFIAETVFYPSNSDISAVEGYMAHKWGLNGNLPTNHPYKDAPPTQYSDAETLPDELPTTLG